MMNKFYSIFNGESLLIEPQPFNKKIFERIFRQLGVQISLSTPVCTSGTYRIVEIDDLSTVIDPRFQYYGQSSIDLNSSPFSITRQVHSVDVKTFLSTRIDEVVQIANQLLNQQARGYADIQIAAWPQIQSDVIAYNQENAVIGLGMQNAMAESDLTAAELAAIITPKINFKNAVFSNRNTHIATLKTLDTTTAESSQPEIDAVLLAIADYDINAGWPR